MSPKRYQRRLLVIHWTTSKGIHGAAECGSSSISYTSRTELVTCPRCIKRRDFKAAKTPKTP